tara:strand:- start:183 stop:521 length:339 start_codon:yes stop_codon:yes gene_type:complete
MNQNKFRAWHEDAKEYCEGSTSDMFAWIAEGQPVTLEQFIGLQDSSRVDYCVGDIAEFPNGDRFIIEMEDWLEVFVVWIGHPECEDQAKELDRISEAKIIGNKHINPELIKL